MPSFSETSLAVALLVFLVVTASSSIAAFRRRRRDVSTVEGSLVLGSGIRAWYFEQLQPFEDACARAGITPAALTYGQLFLSCFVAAFYAAGMLFTGGWFLLCAGSLDIIDGRLARRTGSGSLRGAFLDSVVDRYADALAFLGLAVFFRHSVVLWFVLLAFMGAQMVSYARARGEALGASGQVGMLQRPERYVFLGFGTILGSLMEHIFGPLCRQEYAWVAAVVVVLAVAINLTAIQRARHIWRELGGR